MSENLKELVMEEKEPELEVAIIENRIRELELNQQAYQQEIDEKFNIIFQKFGI